MSIPNVLAPSASKKFKERLHNFDPKLSVSFNCERERWELYRYSKSRMHWVMAIEEEDGSYRKLDGRVFKQLYQNDLIARYGSIANWEKAQDEKQKKWQDGQQKTMDHELRSDIKDDWKLWQGAAENFQSGRVNSPPEERESKIISCPK